MVSFIFKKRTVRTNELPTQSVLKSVTTVILFGFGWIVATPAASQQHKKIFFLATNTLLQVPVLKIQVPAQVPVLCMQVQVPVPVPSTTRLLNSCWNSVYRRVFNFCNYDSVGRLDFQHLRTCLIVVLLKRVFIQAIM